MTVDLVCVVNSFKRKLFCESLSHDVLFELFDRCLDFIIGIEFDNIGCEEAVAEYEKRGVIVFERSAKSLYSRRMVEAFGSQGVVRVSPLPVHGPGDIARFLRATREIAKTTPTEKA